MEGVLTGGTGALGGIGATGALSILGGLGLGLAGVGVMEATGITSLYGDITTGWGKRAEKQGVIEQWGGSAMDALTGDLENTYIADYLKTHNGALPPEYEWKNGSIVRRDLPYAGEFAEGGLVPGPSGQPVNATLHGGEVVVPEELAYKSMFGDRFGGQFGNYGTMDDWIRGITSMIEGASSGLSITIDKVILSKDYNLQDMTTDARAMAQARRSKGIPTR
jgi:hypothetical protein